MSPALATQPRPPGGGRYPFTPYPNRSWFKVAFADEVRPGSLMKVTYFGVELAIVRDGDGVAHMLGGTCPVHGAPFDRLTGSTLLCRHDGSGQGVDIRTGWCADGWQSVAVWHVTERNGLLYTWYDAADSAPEFDVPFIPEHGEREFTGYNKLHWVVRTHIQEVAENAVDLAHFAVLHEYHEIPAPNVVETTDRQLIVDITSRRKILWITRDTDLHLEYTGMGCVIARVASKDVDLVAHLTPTPVDDEHINVNLSIMFRKTRNVVKDWLIRTFVFREIKREFERDIMVWEHKAFHARPILCKDDGPVGKVRSWAKNYY